MKNKINIHNFWRSDAFIILMFAVMSVVSVAVMWNAKTVSVGSDLAFHWKRIYEIHDSILNSNFTTTISLNTFNQAGSAVMSLYPNLNMYAMASISLFIKSFIGLYYLSFILRNFFSLIVGYYSCKSFVRNKKISFIFSVVYTLSTFTLAFQSGGQLGISSSIIFTPLILFGFLNLLKQDKWIELTIGMSAVILCHLVDTLIVLLFLIMMLIINYKQIFNKNTLKALGKSILFTLLITSIFWVSFLILMFNNNIGTPPLPPHSQIGGQPLKVFVNSVINHVYFSISLACLIGLFLGIFRYKFLSKWHKQLLFMSMIFLYLCSNFFPWMLFHHTIIEGAIQSAYRFFIIPELLLSYLFAVLIIELLHNDKKQIFGIIGITLVVLITQGMGQKQVIYGMQNKKALNHDYTGDNNYIITNNSNFRHLISGYAVGQYDYYPKQSIKMYDTINQHLATYDGNKHIKMKLLGNGGYEFTNQARIKDLSLPFLYYNGISYQVKLDGKTVNGFANKNSLMTIKNVNKGHHRVRIIVHNTKMQIVSYITSLIGLIILLGAIIKKYIKRR